LVDGAKIEERSFVASLLWMTAKGGWCDGGRSAAPEPDGGSRGRVRGAEKFCAERSGGSGGVRSRKRRRAAALPKKAGRRLCDRPRQKPNVKPSSHAMASRRFARLKAAATKSNPRPFAETCAQPKHSRRRGVLAFAQRN
jgi:hypothetical protein